MFFFDSHAHYNDAKFDDDREEIIRHIYNKDIKKVIVAGYNIESSKRAIEIANNYGFVYATCGISPNDLGEDIIYIEELAKNKKIVAIGEIGLDYYWNKDNKEEQRKIFIRTNRNSK